jgi:hypothetical protein
LTIDPRSLFSSPQNVLEKPSLIDGSESPSSDEAQGAAADVSTACSHIDPGETVSDASQLAVTDEGSVCATSFLGFAPAPIYSKYFGLEDKASEVLMLETSGNTLPRPVVITVATPPLSSTSPTVAQSPSHVVPSPSQSHLSSQSTNSRSSIHTNHPRTPMTCPLCPRTFRTQRHAG